MSPTKFFCQRHVGPICRSYVKLLPTNQCAKLEITTANISTLRFYRGGGCPFCRPNNSVRALSWTNNINQQRNNSTNSDDDKDDNDKYDNDRRFRECNTTRLAHSERTIHVHIVYSFVTLTFDLLYPNHNHVTVDHAYQIWRFSSYHV